MRIFIGILFLFLIGCGSAQSTRSSGEPIVVAHGGGNVYTRSNRGVSLSRAFAEPMRVAGGRSARIVTVASRETDADSSLRTLLQQAGYRNVYHLNIRDPQATQEIAAADVIYFDGGVQTRLMRKLNANPAIKGAITDSYRNGAVLAGVSAGAAVMSDLMICCDRAGRAVPSRGLGVLQDVVIDQHYSERNRQFRLQQIISQNPKLIGVGIDEEMAVVFTPSQMRVTGAGGTVTIVRNVDGRIVTSSHRSGIVPLEGFNTTLPQPSGQAIFDVETLIQTYAAGDYVEAFRSLPNQQQARRMRNSAAFGAMPSPQAEKGVVEELLCFEFDRCDAIQ